MLKAGEKMFAYSFEGYWKDVGTIQSLWEANMDLLGEHPTFSLDDEKWRVYSRHAMFPPQFVGEGAKIVNSIISEGCEVYGTVENSILFGGVTVLPGAVVKDSVVMGGTVVGRGATLSYSLIDSNVEIGAGAKLGGEVRCEEGVTVIGDGTKIADGETVKPGAMIPDLR